MSDIIDISEAVLKLFGGITPLDSEAAIVEMCISDAEGNVKRFLEYDPAYKSHTEFYPSHDFSRSSREALWEVSETRAFLRRLAEASTVDLQIRHLPIRAPIVDLRIDYDGRHGARPGSFPDSSKMIEGTDFWPVYDTVDSKGNSVCSDGILKSEGLWPAISGAVKITYNAGYTADELRGRDPVIDASPIWAATMDETVRRVYKVFKQIRSPRFGFQGALTSERLGDYSYNVDPTVLQSLIVGADLSDASIEKLTRFENIGWKLMS